MTKQKKSFYLNSTSAQIAYKAFNLYSDPCGWYVEKPILDAFNLAEPCRVVWEKLKADPGDLVAQSEFYKIANQIENNAGIVENTKTRCRSLSGDAYLLLFAMYVFNDKDAFVMKNGACNQDAVDLAFALGW